MSCQSVDKLSSVESVVDDIIEQHHHFWHFVFDSEFYDFEIVISIEHVKILDHFLVSDITLTEACCLVKD